MKEQSEIEEKQQYLKSEILDQGYDADKFSEYICTIKENGTDLNNWTLEELQNIVISFKKQEKEMNNNNNAYIEKEVENVRNSFILSESGNSNNEKNPYDKIFEDKEDAFKGVPNIMSDLNKEEENKKNKVWSEMGDFEIIDASDFIDSSKDILKCQKARPNGLTKFDNISVNITG